jgi:hypothetical protein
LAPHSKRSSASDLVCEANTKHNVWIRRCAAGSAPAVSPIVHARSAQVGIGERESRRGWGQQLVVRGQLHSPMVKLVMRVAHVAPIRARCFNSKRTSFHVALELEHVESVDLRSAIRKADAVLPAFARAGQRGDTLKRVAQCGRCRLLFLLGVQHISDSAARDCRLPPGGGPRAAAGSSRARRQAAARQAAGAATRLGSGQQGGPRGAHGTEGGRKQGHEGRCRRAARRRQATRSSSS